ncbi:growth hormone secretagogue receptor type 1-like [Ylistrum balloti]|uniref:growth hormone secretagogue receptor type 1-like n=1 Tax=Ylistrum balloti TaxID=509963 RepID=UPI002905E921|nr:growth hormone secretagogue receptor type 1-like [Ylistrum balloti]
MTNDTTFHHFQEFQTAVMIWLYFPPFLIIIGTIANLLAIVVLLRKPMRTSNTMFYLLVLSFGDIFVLYTGLLRFWLKFGFDQDIRLISNAFCKFHGFLVYVSLDFTAWVLVAVTVDRCFSICHPFKAKVICTRKVAKITVCVILGTLIAINGHLFWSLAIKDLADEIQCTGVTYFANSIWPWIDFSVFSGIPFSIMITSNIIIVRQLCRSSRRLMAHKMTDRTRCNAERSDIAVVKPDSNSTSNQLRLTSNSLSKNGSERNRIQQRTGKISNVTVMLLSINCLFLLLTAPIVIYLIGYIQWYVNVSDHSRAKMNLLWCFCNMMQYLNNSIHFFIYCLTGPKFRRELKSTFTKGNRVAITEQISGTELY